MSIASELTVLQGYIGDAYDTVNDKGGTIPTDKNMANLATAIDSIPGGGSAEVVNGIIENFKATSATIDANTFVEFVNNTTTGTDTRLSNTSNTAANASAALLDTDRVFIAHGSNGGYLYGVVCTISGTTITAGEDTQLSTGSNSQYRASAVVLDTGKVFIAHASYVSANYRLYGVVCTISGTTITAGEDTELSSISGTGSYVTAELLDTDRVFIALSDGSYLGGMVCTISGTTITAGEKTRLSIVSNSYDYASAVVLDTGKVFIAHRNGNYLYGVVCTISGTTITVSTDTQLSTVSYSYYYASAVLVDTNKIFIAHRNGNYLYGMVCTISGTTITAGEDTQLSTDSNSYPYASAALMDTNKIFIAHPGGSSYLYGMVCTISGTTITVSTDTQLSTRSASYQNSSTVLVGPDKLFIAHSDSNYLSGIITNAPDPTVQPATKSREIFGLTKTACTTSADGEVWILAT